MASWQSTNSNYLNAAPVTGTFEIRDPSAYQVTVTTLADTVNAADGATSLREAIANAAILTGNQTITFDPGLFAGGAKTISLSNGGFSVNQPSGKLTIVGPGARSLSLDGLHASRIFNAASSLEISGMTLANGQSSYSGAAIQNAGTLVASDCVFQQNTAAYFGGALYNYGAATLSRCSFLSNATGRNLEGFAGRGGAIENESYLKLVNCTFHGNAATTGGAIANHFSSANVILADCTLTANVADLAGGGLGADRGFLTLWNSIVSGNTAPNIHGTPNGTWLSTNLLNADPTAIFTTGVPGDYGGQTPTIALKPGGPAIDAGDNTVEPQSTDQRGAARILNGRVDIGAYEFPLLPTVVSPSLAGIGPTNATLGGNVANTGGGAIAPFGVLVARTADNPNPAWGGAGVTVIPATGATGTFTVAATGLTPLTSYSFVAFATNEAGVAYSPIGTFQTHELPGLVVTTPTDGKNAMDGVTSLREALAYAQSLGGAQTITFDPALAGQTVTLNTGWNDASDASALRVAGKITVQGLTTAPGITLAVQSGAQKRHFLVEGSGNLTLSHLTLTNGAGPDYGGAVWNFGALTVKNCTFAGNHAGAEGGAIQSWGDSPLLLVENSTFPGNSSSGVASAIDAGSVSMTLSHVTITDNTATNAYAALVLWKYQATLVNSIVAGNSDGSLGSVNGGTFAAASVNNLIGTGGTGGLVNGVNGNLVGVPANRLYLGALANNGGPTATVALLPGSPAINSGVAIAGLATDQRGLARAVGSTPDIGAIEDSTGDSDPDGDTLSNAKELALGSDPLLIGSDGDGFNDATEMLAGSNPGSAASVPPATHIERVFGFGPARGLDLTGNFLYAFNVGTPGAAGQAGDAYFTADNASGITVSAPNAIAARSGRVRVSASTP